MSEFFIDGFDKYGPTGYLGLSETIISEWTTCVFPHGVTTAIGIGNGLSATGNSIYVTNDASISKTIPNKSQIIGGIRFKDGVSGPYFSNPHPSNGIVFADSNTPQFQIMIEGGTGFIKLIIYSGIYATTAATSSVSVRANSVHYLEWDITLSSTGAYYIYLDSVLILSGTANTSGGTENDYINQIQLQSNGGSASIINFDDLYLFDSSGSVNNSVLLTNPRIETQLSVSDSQKQFSNGGAIIGNINPYSNTTISNGSMSLVPVIPSVNMTLDSLNFVGVSAIYDNITAVVYSDVAGTPTTLLSNSLDTIGYGGPPVTIALISSVPLVAGTKYWIGFMYKTNLTPNPSGTIQVATYNNSLSGRYALVTYGSPPGTAPTMSSFQPSYMYYGNCSAVAHNWISEVRNPPPGDTSFIYSSTVGNEDLYNFPVLSTHPTAIYTVAVKAYAKLTDTGIRTVDLRMKSSSSDSAGSDAGQTPGTSYEWVGSFFPNDPNTSTTWTESGLNSALSGIKVAS